MKRPSSESGIEPGLKANEYQILVDELMKDQPDQALVRRLMRKQGITYTQDPIAQMSLVLKSMGSKTSKTKEPYSL